MADDEVVTIHATPLIEVRVERENGGVWLLIDDHGKPQSAWTQLTSEQAREVAAALLRMAEGR